MTEKYTKHNLHTLPDDALRRAVTFGVLNDADMIVLAMLYGLADRRIYTWYEVCTYLGLPQEDVEEIHERALIRVNGEEFKNILSCDNAPLSTARLQISAVKASAPIPAQTQLTDVALPAARSARSPQRLEAADGSQHSAGATYADYEEQKEDSACTFARYLKAMIELYGKFPWVLASDICGSSTTANTCSARHMLMYLLWRNGGFSYHQIADLLNKTYGATCRGIKRIKVLLEKNDQQTIDDFARFRSKMGWKDV